MVIFHVGVANQGGGAGQQRRRGGGGGPHLQGGLLAGVVARGAGQLPALSLVGPGHVTSHSPLIGAGRGGGGPPSATAGRVQGGHPDRVPRLQVSGARDT